MFAGVLLLALLAATAQDPSAAPRPGATAAAASSSRALLPPTAVSSPRRDSLVPPAGYTFERAVVERWMHGRQRPELTPFDRSRLWIAVDSVGRLEPAREGRRTLFLSTGGRGRDPAILVLDDVGRVLSDSASITPLPRRADRTPMDEERQAAYERQRMMTGTPDQPALALPQARLWELVPAFHPPRLRPGARWSDPANADAAWGGFRQSLRGKRLSVLERDTVVAGRHLWLVRHSARVTYAERALVEERTLDSLAVLERRGEGEIRGWYLYDPELRLARVAEDTTSLTGSAALRYADGRELRTPARFERMRTTTLRDPQAQQTRTKELQDSAARGRTGMLILPTTDLERRLASGDVTAWDSVAARWQAARDPDEQDRLFRALEQWGARTPERRAELFRIALARGDTGRVVRDLVRRGGWRAQIDTAALRLLLPFMADPGLAFSFGLARDPFYENPAQVLLLWPPSVTADTARWPCTPAACRMLAAQRRTSAEPRLRALALVASLALDPPRWADTVLVEAGVAPGAEAPPRARPATARMLVPAVWLIRGIATTAPAGSHAPLPGPGADWRAWLEWMSGRDPRYPVPERERAVAPRFRSDTHLRVLRFQQALTGRDLVRELGDAFRQATTDSARVVFGSMVLGIGAYRPDPAAAERDLRSSSPADRDLGWREVEALFRDAPPADSATTETVLQQLLAIALDGAPLWPSLAARDASPGGGRRHRVTNESTPVFVAQDDLPPALRERWRTRLIAVPAAAWRERSDTLAATYLSVSRVQRSGRFVHVRLDYQSRTARTADRPAGGWAGGFGVYLLETAGGFVLVGMDEWIT